MRKRERETEGRPTPSTECERGTRRPLCLSDTLSQTHGVSLICTLCASTAIAASLPSPAKRMSLQRFPILKRVRLRLPLSFFLPSATAVRACGEGRASERKENGSRERQWKKIERFFPTVLH
ncbi:hypothetical protein GPALN_010703 [Globodera pallida]|nr:hypothetical protein GPALN_010703 [Globodera pallida]